MLLLNLFLTFRLTFQPWKDIIVFSFLPLFAFSFFLSAEHAAPRVEPSSLPGLSKYEQ